MGMTHLNPLNAKLNPICHLLALLVAHHTFHVSELEVKIYHIIFNNLQRHLLWFLKTIFRLNITQCI